jgi:hypothetical protein
MLGPLPQPRVLADLGACAVLERTSVVPLQAEPALHPTDGFLQNGQTLHLAACDDRFPHNLLRGSSTHPHQFPSRFRAGAAHVATLRSLSLFAGWEGRQIEIEHQPVTPEIVVSTLTVRAKQLAQRCLQVSHILLGFPH